MKLPVTLLLPVGFSVMAVATQIGWKFINEPKLIYFSNLLDRPRPEIWAGLLLAALALALTNLLCMPLVYGYWVLAFRPKGGRTVLILQGIALVGFLVWYGLLLV